jgi:arabinan endo-1,5-alpha-L-arabinosidase
MVRSERAQTLGQRLVVAAALTLVVTGCSSSIPKNSGGAGGIPAGGSGGSASGGRPAGSGGDNGTVGGGGGGGMLAGGTGGRGTAGASVPDAGVSDAPVVADSAPPGDTGPGDLGTGPVPMSATHFDINVHDPAMIWDGSQYYLFATGGSLNIRSSTDLTDWASAGRVLPSAPSWITTAVPGVGSLWAPDVSYFNGRFHLYYAGSTSGSNLSVIGLATNTTLDPSKAGYAWIDEGLVVQSLRTDNYNAIDPNVAFDAAGAPWLSFGSFWSGIKLRKLDPGTGKPAVDDPTLYSIASRNGGAIEAPSIISHGGYYYLFVSFDNCCAGLRSTYRTMVGRATTIVGPYLDSKGIDMMLAGGDQLLGTSGRYIGPGGGTAWRNGENYLYVYHYYDGMTANGTSKLQIRPVNFTADGWIALGEPLFP